LNGGTTLERIKGLAMQGETHKWWERDGGMGTGVLVEERGPVMRDEDDDEDEEFLEDEGFGDDEDFADEDEDFLDDDEEEVEEGEDFDDDDDDL
jgi:hypothetical protein